jgi:hypothetical protein
MSGPRTIPVQQSLADAGCDVWTPVCEIEKRRPRSQARTNIEVPILPTFVFAREADLPYLARCTSMMINPHPAFSIFHYCGRIPIIADADIANLREVERQMQRDAVIAKRKASPRTFPAGSAVRLDDGPCAGMSGIVKRGDHRFALVGFGARFEMEIATFLLSPDRVSEYQPVMGAAA